MKKLYFIIAGLIVVVVIVFLLLPDSKKSDKAVEGLPPGHPDVSQMKGDDKGGPNKMNVREDFLKELQALKEQVDAQKPGDTTAVWKLARLLNESHKMDDAIKYYERLAKVLPKNTDLLLDMSVTYFNAGKLNESMDATKRILKIQPANTIAMYNIGAILAEMGKTGEAKTEWQKLIAKYPASADAGRAKEAIGRLEHRPSPH